MATQNYLITLVFNSGKDGFREKYYLTVTNGGTTANAIADAVNLVYYRTFLLGGGTNCVKAIASNVAIKGDSLIATPTSKNWSKNNVTESASPSYNALLCRLFTAGGLNQRLLYLKGIPYSVVAAGVQPPQFGPLPPNFAQSVTNLLVFLGDNSPNSNGQWSIKHQGVRRALPGTPIDSLVVNNPMVQDGLLKVLSVLTPPPGSFAVIGGLLGSNVGRLNGIYFVQSSVPGVSFTIRMPTRWRLPFVYFASSGSWILQPTAYVPINSGQYERVVKRDTGVIQLLQRGAAVKEK